MINWNAIFNRLFKLIDQPGEPYFSGPRFIRRVQEVDPFISNYSDYIEERKNSGKSTTRRDYFRDIFLDLDEGRRAKLVNSILDEVEKSNLELSSEIRKILGGGSTGPTATVPSMAWHSERLNEFLSDIDAAIAAGNYERAVTLSYTCLEGFLGAFVRAKFPTRETHPEELISLAKEAKNVLKETIKEYPDELLNFVTQTAYAVDRSRNRFSESHFAGEAGSWMATYVRDLVNSEIRLLLHFM
jgi:hypothetical protein